MGIKCQILVQKTPEGVYRPNDKVKGSVKYILDEETVFTNIVLSIKGKGQVDWSEPGDDSKIFYSNFEEYVNVQTNLLKEKSTKSLTLQAGMYVDQFEFILPENIPSTYKDSNCEIVYYVRLKFIKISMLNSVKKFRKCILVVNPSTPAPSPTLSLTNSSSKYLSFMLMKSDNAINITAGASKNYIFPGENVEVNVELENDTRVDIKKLNVYVVEKITYVSKRGTRFVKNRKVKGCKTSTGEVQITRGKGKQFNFIVPSLSDCHTIVNSSIFSREFKIVVMAKLPMPHRNLSLDIPLVIGESARENITMLDLVGSIEDLTSADCPPPSYWESMDELDAGMLANKSQ